VEKDTIIEEVFTYGRVQIDDKANLTVNTMGEDYEVPDTCPKCGGQLEVVYSRPDELLRGNNDYDLVVSKCSKCLQYYAFWIEPFTDDPSLTEPSEKDEHMGGRVIEPPHWRHVGKPEWGEGKPTRIPRAITKAYKQAVHDTTLEKLDKLLLEKRNEMLKAGLSNETINSARSKALVYLRKNAATKKQLLSLVAAALYVSSHEELICLGGLARVTEKISARRLEEVMGVTSKTIRKWKTRVPQRNNTFYV
jgi:hypothetical protein